MTLRTSAASFVAVLAAATVAACGAAPESGSSDDAFRAEPRFVDGTSEGSQLANGTLPSSTGASTSGARPASAKLGSAAAAAQPADDDGDGAATYFSAERQVASKLGLPNRFAIGLGNDAETADPAQVHAYTLGPKLDIHYMYLSGLNWPEWNLPAGAYVGMHANAAKARGVVPMFTLYQGAAYGENNLGAFDTATFMTKYWRGVRVMFEQLAAFDAPAIVHVEPDLWGYAQRRGDDPAATPMKVGSLVPECSDLPSNVAGMAKCVIRLGRQIAPKTVIGLSASSFGAFTNGISDPARIATFMNAIGANEADILVVETLDRDAGCFERATDPLCKRAGNFYWDETNTQHPNFHDHLAWAKSLRTLVGKPLLWWQMPLGVPSDSAGSAGRYRDNRVRYLFAHPAEFAAAGGIGAVFGTGAPNQTTAKTDNNQFKNALLAYQAAAPVALP